jgi:hypothetical protein
VLANLKIRRKLLVLVPLAAMVFAATTYSSIEMLWANARYSALIAIDVKTIRSLPVARAKNTRFGQIIYEEMRQSPNEVHEIEELKS